MRQFYTAPTLVRALEAQDDKYVTDHDRSSLRILGTVGEPINPRAWLWFFEASPCPPPATLPGLICKPCLCPLARCEAVSSRECLPHMSLSCHLSICLKAFNSSCCSDQFHCKWSPPGVCKSVWSGLQTVGEEHCPIVDTWWQTETGAAMITPLPGAWPCVPGSATLPFFGVLPVILDDKVRPLHGGLQGLVVFESRCACWKCAPGVLHA